MKRLSLFLLTALLLCAVPRSAQAQYYSWGSDAPQRWQLLRDGQQRVIAPDTALGLSQRTLHYLRAVRPTVGAGFRYGPLRIPFVLHPENAQANGLVMYMPKRVEFLSSPAVESYSMPWTKQLVAHEYRHAVQYNNLNRGVVRALSFLLGQQGSTVGLLFLPMWVLEGDAVLNETIMSTYGRGLQPSFSMGYRAAGRVGTDRRGRERRNVDRWFCGSYRTFIPDHYALGYQLCAHAYDRYGENIWNDVGRYGVRNPYTFAPTHIALKKYYGTTVRTLFRETFDRLESYWVPLRAVVPNSRPLVAADTADYTTYRWPLELPDGDVLALKSSYARTAAFVAIDREGRERTLARVGELSSRPARAGDTLYWTEYERSSKSGSSRGCGSCGSTAAAAPVGSRRCGRPSTPPRRPRGWRGSSTVPRGGMASSSRGARAACCPWASSCTVWPGTTARRPSTPCGPMTTACRSCASTSAAPTP